MTTRKSRPHIKTRLHKRNRNRQRYDLNALTVSLPELAEHVTANKHGADSIDFSNPRAVKLLNRALLRHYYGIHNWDFPDAHLCPPIPGRADYLHYLADLLAGSNHEKVPHGKSIICLDIGVGATCIYPIIGHIEYGWSFIGSDTEQTSLDSAQSIIDANPDQLNNRIQLRRQKDPNSILTGVIDPSEKIDLTMCNPPFHPSAEKANIENRRKVKNLTRGKKSQSMRNFSGMDNELIYAGGASTFIRKMIEESRSFADNCLWFSSLVAKQAHLKGIHAAVKKADATQVQTISMGTGNKSTRIVAWTFLSQAEQRAWSASRWQANAEEE